MKLEYRVVFIPRNIEPEKVDETRCVKIKTDKRFGSLTEIKQRSNEKALRDNIIDRYAMRKDYWIPACCDLEVINRPWKDTRQLRNYLVNNYNIENISRIRNNWIRSSVECVFENSEIRKKENEKINKDHPSIITVANNDMMKVSIREKGHIEIENEDISKSIFEKAELK